MLCSNLTWLSNKCLVLSKKKKDSELGQCQSLDKGLNKYTLVLIIQVAKKINVFTCPLHLSKSKTLLMRTFRVIKTPSRIDSKF